MGNIKEGQPIPITAQETQITPPLIERRQPEKIGRSFKGKDILSIDQFNPLSIADLFSKVPRMSEIARNSRQSHVLDGDIVVHLFYEPSTRTRTSFEASVLQLGGNAIVINDPENFSSQAKGENLDDTIRTFEAYCDAIVVRSKEEGEAQRAADIAEHVPIINAGDGKGEHPTQALLDLYTIHEKFGRLSGLTGLIAGDIKHGRTVHSLLKGLALYPGNSVYLLSPDALRLNPVALDELRQKGLEIEVLEDKKDIPEDANFWYWTRLQKERIESVEEIEKIVDSQFIVNNQLMKEKANPDMILMHPLPRVGEILPEVDADPRAVYLKSQVRNGMYVRMALLGLILGRME